MYKSAFCRTILDVRPVSQHTCNIRIDAIEVFAKPLTLIEITVFLTFLLFATLDHVPLSCSLNIIIAQTVAIYNRLSFNKWSRKSSSLITGEFPSARHCFRENLAIQKEPSDDIQNNCLVLHSQIKLVLSLVEDQVSNFDLTFFLHAYSSSDSR